MQAADLTTVQRAVCARCGSAWPHCTARGALQQAAVLLWAVCWAADLPRRVAELQHSMLVLCRAPHLLWTFGAFHRSAGDDVLPILAYPSHYSPQL